jgi:hypothetical protein
MIMALRRKKVVKLVKHSGKELRDSLKKVCK